MHIRCDHLSDQALAVAAGSREVLENARVFPTLQACVKDLQQVIATTARPRKITQLVYTPDSAAVASVLSDNRFVDMYIRVSISSDHEIHSCCA